ncbi:hypothetical protein F5878DRAFT_643255 [Lentinula raphanica]|uniref:Uncharacterized protein n=1 Tax=Lentinula raphanica TaxID=153919 RepID=A0AA38UC36_9AGAR|nr:hypothetical protein F5878DRAFT_643255 [Lentinula raphanica]
MSTGLAEDLHSEFPELLPEQNPPTNYGKFVISMLKRMPRDTPDGDQSIDQAQLRKCISLSSSFLVTDTSMDPEHGINTWFMGFSRLIDVVIALHARGELDIEMMNAASKACSECWSAAGAWKGLEESREGVRKVVGKLKKLLDENGRTYRGERVYAP